MNNDKTVLVILIYVVFSLFIFLGAEEKIVAKIDGKNIYYNQIRVSVNKAKISFVEQYKREPTLKELNYRIREIEKQNLLAKIYKIIENELINKFNITVTDKEAQNYYRSIIEKSGYTLNHMEKEVTASIRTVVVALKEYVKNPSKDKEIYAKYFGSVSQTSLPPAAWKWYKSKYGTPEGINKLEKMLQKSSFQTLSPPALSLWKNTLKRKKLQEKVSSSIRISSYELEEYYCQKFNKKKIDNYFSKIKHQLYQELKDKKINEWWKKEIKKFNIVIIEPRFKDVSKLLENAKFRLY